MSKLVTVPYLAAITVEIEDENLSEAELIDLAMKAVHHVGFNIDNDEIQEELGEVVYVHKNVEALAYEKVLQGSFYRGHISEVSIEDGW